MLISVNDRYGFLNIKANMGKFFKESQTKTQKMISEYRRPVFKYTHKVQPKINLKATSSSSPKGVVGEVSGAVKRIEKSINPTARQLIKHQNIKVPIASKGKTFLTLGNVGSGPSGKPIFGLKVTRKF